LPDARREGVPDWSPFAEKTSYTVPRWRRNGRKKLAKVLRFDPKIGKERIYGKVLQRVFSDCLQQLKAVAPVSSANRKTLH